MTTNREPIYTTIQPHELWKVYGSANAIFFGGGNSGSPRLVRPDGPRAKDITILRDPIEGIDYVFPDRTKGISFSSSIARLQRLGIEGRVWQFARGLLIPQNLCFNLTDLEHPLLNVSVKMCAIEFTLKLGQVSEMLKATDVIIKKRRS